MSASRRSGGLQLPAGISDREDRMLAYYINLISQQEEREQRKSVSPKKSASSESVKDEDMDAVSGSSRIEHMEVSESGGSLSSSSLEGFSIAANTFDESTVPAAPESNASFSMTDAAALTVKRPVGRPRKYPRSEESLSLVASPPAATVTPSKSVSESLSHMSLSGGKKTSAKDLAKQEAERIIATILERRPGRAEFGTPERRRMEESSSEDSSEDEEEPKEVSVELGKVEEVIEKIPAIESVPLDVPKEVLAAPRGRGRPPKKSRPVSSSTNVERLDQRESLEVKNPVVEAVVVPPPVALDPPTVSRPPPVENFISFNIGEPQSRSHHQWWKDPVSLDCVPWEAELEAALAAQCSSKQREDHLLFEGLCLGIDVQL